ncbi:MAG: hypothetical protein ABJC39_07695 [Chloroflexota bacterium]
MTTLRNPDALLAAYLVDGMDALPERVADAVLDEVHRTRQWAVFGPLRTRSTFQVGLGAAAVVGVLVVGGAFFIQRGQPSVGPGATAVASSHPSQPAVVGPSATPAARPSPSLEPPADLQAFVYSIYERLPELPPVAMTWLRNGSDKSRVLVHRSGAVRFEYFASADATAPRTYRILNGHRLGMLVMVGADKVWVDQAEAIGEDPRVYILAETESGLTLGGPGCEITRDPSERPGASQVAPSQETGWRYVGLEYVAGRPAHHVACVGDLWIDVETGLILRTREQVRDAADQPIAGEFRTAEVTEIEFGEQPAALFAIAPPKGVASVSMEEWGPHECALNLVCSELPPGSDTPAIP